jgi:hypothetical protein
MTRQATKQFTKRIAKHDLSLTKQMIKHVSTHDTKEQHDSHQRLHGERSSSYDMLMDRPTCHHHFARPISTFIFQ